MAVTSSRNGTAARATDPGSRPDDLVILLVRTTKLVIDRLRAERGDVAGPELTVIQGLAAQHLVDRADVTTSGLARYLDVTKQSAAEIVAALEGAGLVRRAPHPTDGRARVLLLTDAGRARIAEGRARWRDLERAWEQLVGADDLATMRGVLSSYLEHAGD